MYKALKLFRAPPAPVSTLAHLIYHPVILSNLQYPNFFSLGCSFSLLLLWQKYFLFQSAPPWKLSTHFLRLSASHLVTSLVLLELWGTLILNTPHHFLLQDLMSIPHPKPPSFIETIRHYWPNFYICVFLQSFKLLLKLKSCFTDILCNFYGAWCITIDQQLPYERKNAFLRCPISLSQSLSWMSLDSSNGGNKSGYGQISWAGMKNWTTSVGADN